MRQVVTLTCSTTTSMNSIAWLWGLSGMYCNILFLRDGKRSLTHHWGLGTVPPLPLTCQVTVGMSLNSASCKMGMLTQSYLQWGREEKEQKGRRCSVTQFRTRNTKRLKGRRKQARESHSPSLAHPRISVPTGTQQLLQDGPSRSFLPLETVNLRDFHKSPKVQESCRKNISIPQYHPCNESADHVPWAKDSR